MFHSFYSYFFYFWDYEIVNHLVLLFNLSEPSCISFLYLLSFKFMTSAFIVVMYTHTYGYTYTHTLYMLICAYISLNTTCSVCRTLLTGMLLEPTVWHWINSWHTLPWGALLIPLLSFLLPLVLHRVEMILGVILLVRMQLKGSKCHLGFFFFSLEATNFESFYIWI